MSASPAYSPSITFTEVTASTAAASVSDANLNRVWRLTSASDFANIPPNGSRRRLVVDASISSLDAFGTIGTTDDPSESAAHFYIGAGATKSFDIPQDLHAGHISIGIVTGTDTDNPVIVTEYSY